MKGIFIPEITVEMFRNRCLEAIETLMVEGEIYDIDYEPELVRCKDCKHWYPDADCGMACEFTNMSQPEDGYCNWGVKKDGMD